MPPPSWETHSAPPSGSGRLAGPGRTALDEYKVWQEAEKLRLYEEVYRMCVTRATLEAYRERIGLLRQRQLQLEEELENAERDLQAAEAELQVAKRKRLDAHRQVVKFEEYQAVLEAEQKREAETQGGSRGG